MKLKKEDIPKSCPFCKSLLDSVELGEFHCHKDIDCFIIDINKQYAQTEILKNKIILVFDYGRGYCWLSDVEQDIGGKEVYKFDNFLDFNNHVEWSGMVNKKIAMLVNFK